MTLKQKCKWYTSRTKQARCSRSLSNRHVALRHLLCYLLQYYHLQSQMICIMIQFI